MSKCNRSISVEELQSYDTIDVFNYQLTPTSEHYAIIRSCVVNTPEPPQRPAQYTKAKPKNPRSLR